ncbi:AAA family ATPase [Ruminococcus flavefaciens]|uniref:AAA family ATPase n=1 Tax=Ruminococcus flavefaciens TaxID=1265 RepID=UPI0026EE9DA3|nr:AAA family ATPase [Ruminococcus flavefaciens]
MIVSELLQHLSGVVKSGSGYKAKCPCHEDKEASLSITENEKGIGLHCFAGCHTEDILNVLNLKMSDLFQEQPQQRRKKQEVARYSYYDLDGHFIATKHRYFDGVKKSFMWEQPNNVWKKPKTAILYNWHNVKDCKALFVVEGEKDVDTLTKYNMSAVSLSDGVQSIWYDEYTEFFRDRHVFIIPDNDDPGRALKDKIIEKLSCSAQSLTVIDLRLLWHNIPKKADITDYFESGGSVEKFKEFVNNAKTIDLDKLRESTPQIKSLYDYSKYKSVTAKDLQSSKLEPVRFLVNDILPEGTALIAAPSKIGKSWFVLDMGLSIAMGKPFLSRNTTRNNVLYLALEDSLNRLQSRMNLILAGDEAPDNFYFWTEAPRLDEELIEILTCFIKEHDIKLIIIDTLQKIRGAALKNEGAYDRDYREMGELKKFSDSNHVSLFIVHHTRKMKDETDSFNMISGTNGIMGAADTAYTLIKEKRESESATLSITGRDVNQISDVVHFDKSFWKWVRDGDLNEVNRLKHKAEHFADPVVQTIITLINERGSWKGRMNELLLEGERITGGDIADNTKQLSNRVKNITHALAFYNNISVDVVKNGSGGKMYSFRKVINGVDLSINGINDTNDIIERSVDDNDNVFEIVHRYS